MSAKTTYIVCSEQQVRQGLPDSSLHLLTYFFSDECHYGDDIDAPCLPLETLERWARLERESDEAVIGAAGIEQRVQALRAEGYTHLDFLLEA